MNNKKNIHLALKLLILAFLGYIVKYLLNICMSNHLKPLLYGEFTATVVAINIVTVIILLGTDSVVIKHLPTYLLKKDRKIIAEFVKWNYKLLSKTFLICITVFILLYLTLYLLKAFNTGIELPRHCSVYILWIAPFSALSVLLSSYILSGKLVSLHYTVDTCCS